jgi:hypothetical protein
MYPCAPNVPTSTTTFCVLQAFGWHVPFRQYVVPVHAVASVHCPVVEQTWGFVASVGSQRVAPVTQGPHAPAPSHTPFVQGVPAGAGALAQTLAALHEATLHSVAVQSLANRQPHAPPTHRGALPLHACEPANAPFVHVSTAAVPSSLQRVAPSVHRPHAPVSVSLQRWSTHDAVVHAFPVHSPSAEHCTQSPSKQVGVASAQVRTGVVP